jgi:hypothetical protein
LNQQAIEKHMSKPSLRLHPSMESTTSVGESTPARHSLFDAKDDFIERISPLAVAAIYFGSFSLSPLAVAGMNGALADRESRRNQTVPPATYKPEAKVISKKTRQLSGVSLDSLTATSEPVLSNIQASVEIHSIPSQPE